tara:strand:- start:159 stop:602 length:444 start_codon:yes stop_codon:yes gene_type:complete
MINKELTLNVSLEIEAPISKVWDAVINPEKIKKYFFGTEAISDWKEGSELKFQGEWEGTPYVDKGTILEIESEKILKYDYISSFSQLEDKPENRAIIAMKVSPTSTGTMLEIIQQGFESKETYEHSESNWKSVMEDMKKRVESNDWM